MTISGRVWRKRVGDFTKRMTEWPEPFFRATGENLIPGTLNIEIEKDLPVNEHFRIPDMLDLEQDLLFEVCRIGEIWAYRIRPRNRRTGEGGHSDRIIEITSSQKIPHNGEGTPIDISFFRDP